MKRYIKMLLLKSAKCGICLYSSPFILMPLPQDVQEAYLAPKTFFTVSKLSDVLTNIGKSLKLVKPHKIYSISGWLFLKCG